MRFYSPGSLALPESRKATSMRMSENSLQIGATPASAAPRHPRNPGRTDATPGFTLVEVMVVVTVMAVLIAMTVPHYERALEQSRADLAAANLRAVWTAERFYWLENQKFTSDMTRLQTLGLLDPAVVLATSRYVYSVPTADAKSFTAVAVRSGSRRWSGEFTIDETGTVSGSVRAAGEPDITAGFQ